MNKIIKIHKINKVIELVKELVGKNYNPILILDVDDTVISSKIGKKFVEKDICELVELVYTINPNNLIFLTARCSNLVSYTRNQLNKSGLLHKEKYIPYNVICSPYNDEGESTKGIIIYDYFTKEQGKTILSSNKQNYIIFVDDLMEHIKTVETNLEKLCFTHTCFHYVHLLQSE